MLVENLLQKFEELSFEDYMKMDFGTVEELYFSQKHEKESQPLFIDKYRMFTIDEERDLVVFWDRVKKQMIYYQFNDFIAKEGKFSILLKKGEFSDAWINKQDRLQKAKEARERMKLWAGGRTGKIELNKIELKRRTEVVKQLTFREVFPEEAKKHFIKCPFHNEKTASLKFYDRNFYCFGCGKSGSIIDWYIHINQVPFKQAVKELYERK